MSAGVPTATRLTMTGTPWSAPPFTLNPKRPCVSGLMVTVTTPLQASSWTVSGLAVTVSLLGSGEVSRTVLAWLGGSLEALTGSCDGVSLPLSLLLSSAKLNRAGGLDRSVGDRVLVLGEEEGGPVEGIPGGRLGAWDRSLGMVLARKPPSSSDSSPQALLGDRTPRDWTRLLNDS